MAAAASSSGAVLVLDSNEGSCRLVHAWLTDAAVEHQQVTEAQHAVAAAAGTKFGLVLIDVDADWAPPVVNGFAVASNLRAQGANRDSAILAMTGRTDISEEQWSSAGFNDIVHKPLHKEAFLGKIEQWINQQTSLQLDFSQIPLLETSDLMPPDFFALQDSEAPKAARVLVVEDCTLTQHVICTLLRELTDDVTQAFDGEQAITLCAQHHYDIIYMDIHMPNIGGLQATYHIRNSSNKNTYTPIIAFTSSGSFNDYRGFGMNDMLQKPFTVDALKEQFDKWTPFGQAMGEVADIDPSLESTFDTSLASTGRASDIPTPLDASLISVHSSQGTGSPSLATNGALGEALLGFVMPPLGGRGTAAAAPGSGMDSAAAGSISPGSMGSPMMFDGRMRSGSDSSLLNKMGKVDSSAGMHHSPLMHPNHGRNSPAAMAAGAQFRHAAGGNKSNPRTWPKKKSKNSSGHTEKEKQRRANIVASCNSFRTLVPATKDADKATVFRIAVEYVQFLKSRIPADALANYDQEFADVMSMHQIEHDGAQLSLDASSGAASPRGSRPESPLVHGRSMEPASPTSRLARNVSGPSSYGQTGASPLSAGSN